VGRQPGNGAQIYSGGEILLVELALNTGPKSDLEKQKPDGRKKSATQYTSKEICKNFERMGTYVTT